MNRVMLLVSLLGACYGPDPWGKGARVYADSDNPWFMQKVEVSVNTWNRVMVDTCGPVLELGGPDAHPIRLVDDIDGKHNGAFDGDQILVLRGLDDVEYDDTRAVITHELGHALGAEHVDFEDDYESVMLPFLLSIVNPSSGDVQRMTETLDCD